MTVGRNELCPCGSGKKSKHCCNQGQQSFFKGPGALVLLVVLFGAAAIVAALNRNEPSSRSSTIAAEMPAGTPAASSTSTSTPPPASAPSPTTPPRPGQVWSAEHGHWHNAPVAPVPTPGQPGITVDAGAGAASPIKVESVGQVSDGRVWSAEHGHYHYPQASADSPISNVRPFPKGPPAFTPAPEPSGPAPQGKVWSVEHGHWHDAPKN